MKKYILIFTFSAFLLLLCGCSSSSQSSFEKYSEEAFRQLIPDQLTLHSLLQNPSSYQIDSGNYPAFEDLSENGQQKQLENKKSLLKELNKYNLDKLTPDQQKTALLLKNELEQSISFGEDYPYMKSYLGESGASLGLISNLSQYSLKNTEDINAYFSLLKEVPDYLDQIIDYESRRQKAGYATSYLLLKNELSGLSDFLNNIDKNILITSFEDRMSGLESPESSKEYYIEKNESILRQTIYPAYESYQEKLSAQIKTSSEIERYCQYENGKDYYQALIGYEIGSNLTVEQCMNSMENLLKDSLSSIEELKTDNPLIHEEYLTTDLEITEAEDIAEFLKNMLLIEFPEIDDVELTISRDSYSSANYYLPPAWDQEEKNIVHISPLETDPQTLYRLLAHEAYPGHLYQTNYFFQNIEDPLSLLLQNIGYAEGWASYAEIYSYDFLPLKTEDETLTSQLRDYYRKKRLTEIALYSICDILVNYNNYSESQLQNRLNDYGISNEQASRIYHQSLESPCSYLIYGLGYYEIVTLLEENQTDEESFHKWFLDCGPAPFYLLRNELFK